VPPAGCPTSCPSRAACGPGSWGRCRSGDQITAVFSSDLARAAETASAAFAGTVIPVLYGWRLRECDYGQRNGMPAARLEGRWEKAISATETSRSGDRSANS